MDLKQENKVDENIRKDDEKEQAARPLFVGAKWYDALVIAVLAILSQGIGGVLVAMVGERFGLEQVSEVMRESVDEEVVEYVEFLQSRYVAITLLVATIICFFVVVLYARSKRWRNTLSFRMLGWASPLRLLCGYVLMLCVSVVIEPISDMLPGDQSVLGGGGWLLFSAAVVAPIFEEVIFRGYIAGLLRAAYGGVVAWFFSSLIFGLMHIQPSVIVSASACGLVLGYYYLRHRSLIMVMLLHSMYNTIACFLKTIGLGDSSIREALGGGTLYFAVLGASLFIVVVALWRMVVGMQRLKSDNYQPKK